MGVNVKNGVLSVVSSNQNAWEWVFVPLGVLTMGMSLVTVYRGMVMIMLRLENIFFQPFKIFYLTYN